MPSSILGGLSKFVSNEIREVRDNKASLLLDIVENFYIKKFADHISSGFGAIKSEYIRKVHFKVFSEMSRQD